MPWRTQYAAGDMFQPVTKSPQAPELGRPVQGQGPSMGSMINAYTNKMSGWGR